MKKTTEYTTLQHPEIQTTQGVVLPGPRPHDYNSQWLRKAAANRPISDVLRTKFSSLWGTPNVRLPAPLVLSIDGKDGYTYDKMGLRQMT